MIRCKMTVKEGFSGLLIFESFSGLEQSLVDWKVAAYSNWIDSEKTETFLPSYGYNLTHIKLNKQTLKLESFELEEKTHEQ